MTSAIRAPRTLPSVARVLLAAIVLTATVSIVGPASHPKVAAAQTTAEYMQGLLVTWINDARAARGVPRMRVGTKTTALAVSRAQTLASTNKLAHPSCLGCLLTKWSITWSRCGEVIAGTTYPWGYQAAKSLFNAWKGSSGHWTILMSRSYTRFGIGVAYRSSNHTSFAAGIVVG
jgi:uncharacterized protein YkwD